MDCQSSNNKVGLRMTLAKIPHSVYQFLERSPITIIMPTTLTMLEHILESRSSCCSGTVMDQCIPTYRRPFRYLTIWRPRQWRSLSSQTNLTNWQRAMATQVSIAYTFALASIEVTGKHTWSKCELGFKRNKNELSQNIGSETRGFMRSNEYGYLGKSNRRRR
ncbi:hypothetical protein NEOLEDRAFT_311295 [Neolentinus lepideus HHB14362 ss-1]|uniref:Uncharacterized protein n=1 Tax=Neolentinus lepideus HHB14362 ss-1 TaxID=1314782 RepID=A0A165VSM2_9AGAM|nr:hypothetical protein NEOLEDRAFT_311295 [Neolentinus lepideus HHB14362 ss-1]